MVVFLERADYCARLHAVSGSGNGESMIKTGGMSVLDVLSVVILFRSEGAAVRGLQVVRSGLVLLCVAW